ncbi:hypothetical protein Tco_0465219 [Tanacetum coccineum]
MFANQFICCFKSEANLDTGLVLHQGYLLGGSYHGHDSIFILKCYGVQWKLEVKQTYANVMSVVRPVWSDFRISKVFVDRHKLRGYASAVVSHMDKKFKFKLCKKSKSVEMFLKTTLSQATKAGLSSFVLLALGLDVFICTMQLRRKHGRMFGSEFITIVEPGAKLVNAMVMHKDYLLRGSYHRNNLIFILNCHGIRWQVQLRRVGPDRVAIIGPAWSYFMCRNVDKDVRLLHSVEEGHDTYKEVPSISEYATAIGEKSVPSIQITDDGSCAQPQEVQGEFEWQGHTGCHWVSKIARFPLMDLYLHSNDQISLGYFQAFHCDVMAASTIPVSVEENLGDPINIRVDVIHPEPVYNTPKNGCGDEGGGSEGGFGGDVVRGRDGDNDVDGATTAVTDGGGGGAWRRVGVGIEFRFRVMRMFMEFGRKRPPGKVFGGGGIGGGASVTLSNPYSAATHFGGVTDWHQEPRYAYSFTMHHRTSCVPFIVHASCMVSYKDDLYKLLLVQVMATSTIPISTEENLGDPIYIRVDVIHPEPVAAVAFPAVAIMRIQAQHKEAIRGIQEHLLGVPIQEELTALRFRENIAEAENASLRARIKTTEAIEKITRNRERQARVKIEQQLVAVQESQR